MASRPRRTTDRDPAVVYIPKKRFITKWLIKVDGTDVTTWVDTAMITRLLSEGNSTLNMSMFNDEGNWTGKFDGGEEIEIYQDFDVDTVTETSANLLYKGEIVDPYVNMSSDGYLSFEIESRDFPLFSDETITIYFVEKPVLDCWKGTGIETDDEGNGDDGILYNSGLTFKFWDIGTLAWVETITDAMRTTYASYISTVYEEKSRTEISRETANKGSFDWYLWYNKDDLQWEFRLFPQDSITNTTEQVIVQQNMTYLSRVGYNNTDIKNRIRVYGKTENNIIIVKTKDNTTSQSDLWVKDHTVQDSSLSTMAEVSDKAENLKDTLSERHTQGTVGAIGLKTLQPGQKFRVQNPYAGLNGYYKAKQLTHNLSVNGFDTSISINKREKKTADYFRDNATYFDDLASFENQEGLENSYTVFFDEDPAVVSHSNTEIIQEGEYSLLKLKDGETAGVAQSSTLIHTKNITKVQLRLNTDDVKNLNLLDMYVSANNGANWQLVSPGTLTDLNQTGQQLRFKFVFNNFQGVIESICLLFT